MMFLLNNQQILRHVQDESRSYLDIDPFDENCLNPTSYYFRLGGQYKSLRESNGPASELSERNPKLIIPPRGVVRSLSFESFLLSNKVMAIFGQISDLAKLGLQMLHSPFIDPTFNGRLEIGLANPTDEQVEIQWQQQIGKVCFFDVSDTYPVVRPSKDRAMGKKFDERRPTLRDDDPPHFT
jgi:deoxycytidine triphosphate deaminase